MKTPPFAYLTSTGQSVSIDEFSQELGAYLQSQGSDIDTYAVQGVLRAARAATEATAKGEIPPDHSAYIGHVNQSLRQSRLILGAKDVDAILRGMVVMLSRLDISRVIYLD